MSILNGISNVGDIKKLDVDKLNILASEIRREIISVTAENGGHLASSLGAVEVIIALLYVFDFNKDKIIFDVGHQSYAYKILTERRDLFKKLKAFDGISGFPLIFESPYDSFSSGHAGDSLSASLGYAYARDKKGEDYFIISFIGDGAFCNGETLEALVYSEKKPKKFLTILNDNGMSISPNRSPLFCKNQEFKRENEGLKNDDISKCINFEKLGYRYEEVFDGNNIETLIKYFTAFKNNPTATLLKIDTVKGKGYPPAEKESEFFHGVNKDFSAGRNDFADSLGKILSERMENDDKIVTIVAGMSLGVGVDGIKKRFPNNFIDTGIAEDFAVTFSSSLALSGLKPVVCIYSTFLQRAYDQIVVNVCLQKLPVVFLIDRAGVGSDGYTHQGVFDISYLSHIPNMTLLTPKNQTELEQMLDFALNKKDGPTAIRYPSGGIEPLKNAIAFSEDRLWEVVKEGEKTCILASGARSLALALSASQGTNCEVVNARTIKPLDETFLLSHMDYNFITIEDSIKIGGFGSIVSTFLLEHGYKKQLKIFAFPDKFIPQGPIDKHFSSAGITVEEIRKYL